MATYTENVNVIVDDRGTARVVKRDIAAIGGAAQKTKSAVALLGRAMVGLGAGIGLGIAVNTLREFSQEMSTVKAITGATDAQFKALRDSAKDLGANTRFSATQAAEGMSFLARAGFDTNQVLGSIEGTLKLAQAGALDLGTAADIASNVLTGFRINVNETGRVVDVLAAAANSSNTNVQQLGDGMKYVAPVAAGLGVSLEETTAAVGALSDAGLQATRAGTGLRRILSELESPSKNSEKILKKLGVSTDQVKISQVGLTEALKTLQKAGVDTGLALEIFGDRGGPAFEVLASSIPKVEKLNEKFLQAKGTVDEMSAVMDDNLNGALLSVRSAIEAVILAFGELGAESFLTQFFRDLADSIRWLAKHADDAAQAIGFLIAAMAVSKVVAFSTAVGGAAGAVKALTAAVAANPLGLLLTAITAVVAGLLLFQDEIMVTTDGITTLGDVLTSVWKYAEEALWVFGQAFRDVFSFISSDAEETTTDIKYSLENIVGGTAWAVDQMLGFWTGLWRAIVKLWDMFPDILYNAMVSAINAAINVSEAGINMMVSLINKARSAVGLEEYAEVEFGNIMNLAERTFGETGAIIGNAFKSGFDLTYAQDAVIAVFDDAKKAASERERLAEIAARGNAAGGVPEPKGVVDEGAGVMAGGGGEGLDAFQAYLKSLEDEKKLLSLSNQEREIQQELLALENDLKRELTESEAALAEESLKELQQLQRQRDLLDEIKGPAEEFALQVEALNVLFKEGKITLEEYNDKLAELELEKAGEKVTDFAQTFDSAFSKAGDTLFDFVTDGEADFNGLVVSILDDLQKLAFEMAASELFGEGGSLAGLGGGGGGSSFGGGGAMGAGGMVGSLLGSWVRGYADGGRPPIGRPSVVGEQGPEIFVPDSAGVIVPNNEINVSAPNVNVDNYNMIEPGEVMDSSLQTPRGRKSFMNFIRENRSEIKQNIQ